MTTLLILLFFCHFLADFTPLSTQWMLNAKRLGTPIEPIFAHACVHYALMAFTLFWFVGLRDPWLWVCICQIQLFSHFIIDVLKGRLNGWFPVLQSPANKMHWVVFGADQFLHAVVIVIMAHLATK